jgi:acetyl esterase
MPLDPVTQSINDVVMTMRAAAPTPSVQDLREGYEVAIELIGAKETACDVQHVAVGGLPALLFTPPVHDDGLLVWFHGGGFVIGSAALSRNEVDRLAVASRCRAVSVDYRLAPEHRPPAAQYDAIAAATWCVANAAHLGVDPARIAVGGDSAGGNLAAVAAQRVAGLAAQVLIYPGVHLSVDVLDDLPYQEGYFLDRATLDLFAACCEGEIDGADPLVSPILASRDVLGAVPPAYIATAEYDPIRDQGLAYANALRAAGVDVVAEHFDSQMHGFFSMPEIIDDARGAIEHAGAFIARQFHGREGSTTS